MGDQTFLFAFVVIVPFYNVLGRHHFYEYYYSQNYKGHSTATESVPLSTSEAIPVYNHSDDISDAYPYIFIFSIVFMIVLLALLRWVILYICQRMTDYCIRKLQRRFVNGNQTETAREEEPQQAPVTSRMIHQRQRVVNGNQTNTAKESQAKTAKESVKNSKVVPQQTPSTGRMIHQSPTFVSGNQIETARETVSQQTLTPNILMIHQPPEFQQPYTIQRFYERGQFFPPQYQPHLIQQLPPAQQLHQMQQFPPMQQLLLEQPQFQYSQPAMQSPNPPEVPPPNEFPEKL